MEEDEEDTAGVPDETGAVGVVLAAAAPACLGTRMKNHTTAKMAPKIRRMPSIIRKIARGLF